MSDFPRGWTLTSAPAPGTAPTITVPAIAGVVHVLDSFDAGMLNGAAANANSQITLTSSDGVFTSFPLGMVAAAPNTAGSDSGSGLDLAAGPGASLTIAFAATAAGITEFLRVQGHDI